jgi:hypothetical protein
LTRFLHAAASHLGLDIVVTDPAESAFYTLPWYAQQIYASVGVVLHFSADWRVNASHHNARSALIGGLAVGMKRPILMLAEEDYSDPIDYRDVLFVYSNSRACVNRAREWVESRLPTQEEIGALPPSQRLRLGTELRSVRLGEAVAENEESSLGNYFVETGSFLEVLEDRVTVFIGRKGTGKTANMLRATERLREDARNLVVVIKPYGYELTGLLRVLKRFTDRDTEGYLVESLWKYLLYSEIAIAAANEFAARPPAVVFGTPAQELLDYVNDPANGLTEEFAVRLERAVEGLQEVGDEGSIENARRGIAERLHEGTLQALRGLLGRALADRRRVALLVDNLDKAWDKSGDVDELAKMVLGLLVAIGGLARDFRRRDHWRRPVPVSLCVFLRSDIYTYVARVAREPAKIPVSNIVWSNPELLLRVIEQRYVAGRDNGADPSEVWDRFFSSHVGMIPARDYILSRILPRPRDIVYFCNEAIIAAINSGHATIEGQDVLRAEKIYSEFAFEAILVENGITVMQLEQVLFQFAGARPIVDRAEIDAFIQAAGVSLERSEIVVRRLRELAFVGIEVRPEEFSYDETQSGLARDDVLARKLCEASGTNVRFQIHPAFRAYLEIPD